MLLFIFKAYLCVEYTFELWLRCIQKIVRVYVSTVITYNEAFRFCVYVLCVNYTLAMPN
jgi:hypothetical protein